MSGANIFLNYRRDDTAGHAGRIFDRLNSRFPGRVFRDVTGIDYGADFVREIERKLNSCEALLVIIGRQWLTLAAEDGRRRIDDQRDLVRLEVATGLRRGVTVIPVLVGGARMPRDSELPEDLKPLAARNALEITEPDFDDDVGRLMDVLERALGGRPRPRKKAALVAGLCAAALVSAAILFFRADVPRPAGAAHLASGTTPSPSPSASPAEEPEPTPPPEEPPDAGADSFVPSGSWRVHREDTPWQYAVYTLKPGHKLSYHYRSDEETGDMEGEWSYDKYNHVLTFWGKPGKDGFARHYLRISRKENGYYWVFHSTLGASMMKPEP